MDLFLTFVAHWLPLIQGFAAIASIFGALLSWRFALKAQKARDQMTQNIVASRLLTTFEQVLSEIQDFRTVHVDENGQPDAKKYQFQYQYLKQIFERTVASAAASTPYLQSKISGWPQLLDALSRASISAKPGDIEAAAKHLYLVVERLRISATTRELQPTDG